MDAGPPGLIMFRHIPSVTSPRRRSLRRLAGVENLGAEDLLLAPPSTRAHVTPGDPPTLSITAAGRKRTDGESIKSIVAADGKRAHTHTHTHSV